MSELRQQEIFLQKKNKKQKQNKTATTTATHKLKRFSYLNLYYESQKLLKINLKSKTYHKTKIKYVYMCNIKYIYIYMVQYLYVYTCAYKCKYRPLIYIYIHIYI